MEKMKMPYERMLSLFAELVLDEAIRQYSRQRLYYQIDHALDVRDEYAFLQLSTQLKMLEI